MRKLLHELKRTFPGAEITTNGRSHYRVTLPNGRFVIVSNTPSRKGFMRSAIADARRQARKEQRP